LPGQCFFTMSEPLKFDLSTIFPKEEKRPERIPLPSFGGERPRILVADDDPVFRFTLFDVLTRAGFEVVVAETGTEAIAELRRANHSPVAILGWKMQGMDGLEICERMKDAAKAAYLILSDDHAGSHDIATGLEAGADHVWKKSIPAEELVAQVKAGLRIALRLQSAVH